MTAEAVVMNKTAVALAADSAVTISSGRNGIKTYDTINKLFELVRGSNVGLMIYANAELNGIPWETVVKSYRTSRQSFTAPYLEDYVDDLQRFLADSKLLLPASSDLKVVLDTAYYELLKVFEVLRSRDYEWIAAKSGRIIKTRLIEALKVTLDELESEVDRCAEPPWAETLSEKHILTTYGAEILALVEDLFANFGLSASLMRRLRQYVISAFRKCISEPGDTGLVLAGFGTSDYLPKLYSAEIRGRVSGVLRVAHGRYRQISVERPGHFRTFAQDEQAWGFLSGITDEVRNSVVRYWGEWVEKAADTATKRLTKSLPGLSPATREKISVEFHRLAHQGLDEFIKVMNDRQSRLYIEPTIQSIAMLPKDELGLVAESLVSMTSIKQRMSIFDSQTVGGPIDVALISIGDGFVWLRRKHYFSPKLNPAWHLTHSSTLRKEGRGE